MNKSYGGWRFLGRQDELARLLPALTGRAPQGASVHGAVLVGEPGTGKTALAMHAVEQLAGRLQVVHIRGSRTMSGTGYGALSYFLSQLDDLVETDELAVLAGMAGLLRKQSKGLPLLVLVDNSDELDDQSAMVLAQLAASRVCRLLVLCHSLTSAPAEFMSLWMDGLLARIDLGPLDVAGTRELLEAELGGTVAQSAVAQIQEYTGGIPLLIMTYTREMAAAGKLARQEGYWILTDTGIHCGGEVTEAVLHRIVRWSADERELVELVALASSLPLGFLRMLAGTDQVDALLQRGALETVAGQPVHIRVAGVLCREVIRGEVPRGRNRALLERVLDAAGDAAPPVDPVVLALWSLTCGRALEPAAAVDAAALANLAGAWPDAIRLIESIPEGKRTPAAALERIHALKASGDGPAADAAMAALTASLTDSLTVDPTAAVTDTALRDLTFTELLQARLLRTHPTRWPEARMLLRGARQRLQNSADGQSEDQLRLIREKLAIADVELAVHEGRYTEVVDRLVELYGHPSGQGLPLRLMIGCWLSEAWVSAGRHDEGMALALEVIDRVRELGAPAVYRDLIEARLLNAALLAGRPDAAESMLLQRSASNPEGRLRHGALIDLVQGLLEAHRGHGTRALESLVPAVCRLRLRDPHGVRALGLAATAYAHTLSGDTDQGSRYLTELSLLTERASAQVTRSARYFELLACAVLSSAEAAVKTLLAEAEADRDAGAVSHALFKLAGAARLGSAEAAGQLAAVAAGASGPFARLCTVFGEGLRDNDAHKLVDAASGALALGLDGLSFAAAGPAAALSQTHGIRRFSSEAQRILKQVSGRLDAAGRPPELALTDREREIAELAAAGQSNRSIAGALHLSVRTVEGHLYQIYSKLQVSGRAQLASALS